MQFLPLFCLRLRRANPPGAARSGEYRRHGRKLKRHCARANPLATAGPNTYPWIIRGSAARELSFLLPIISLNRDAPSPRSAVNVEARLIKPFVYARVRELAISLRESNLRKYDKIVIKNHSVVSSASSRHQVRLSLFANAKRSSATC